VSESGLTNPWEPWQRLIDSIGPHYRAELFKARDRATQKFADLDEDALLSMGREGRSVAGSLHEDGARLTVALTDDRERHSRLANELLAESKRVARQARRTVSPRRRRQARADAAEKAAQSEEHRRLAAQAHEQLRELGNSGRHLYPWFERHEEVLARGLAAELALDAAHTAAYHVLGAPGIASLTAACLTAERGIDIARLERLVKEAGGDRHLLLFEVAVALYDREQEVSLTELLQELGGEDLDRVLQAIAMAKRRQLMSQESPTDLWIRAAEPEE
jgi:hypothetical protein